MNKKHLLAIGCLLASATAGRADVLYVSNFSNNTIVKFDSGGGSSVFASAGSGLSLVRPLSLAFDSSSRLYAANSGNDTIEKYTLGGVGTLFSRFALRHP